MRARSLKKYTDAEIMEGIRDLLTTALEGGSNYWYQVNTVIPQDIKGDYYVDRMINYMEKGATIVFSDCNDEDYDDIGTLTHKKLIGSIQEGPLAELIRMSINAEGDACEADEYLQTLVLGEMIYG